MVVGDREWLCIISGVIVGGCQVVMCGYGWFLGGYG